MATLQLLAGLFFLLATCQCTPLTNDLVPSSVDLYDTVQEDTTNEYRIPEQVKPINYDIKLTVVIDPPKTFTFTGDVSIQFQVEKETDTLHIHQQNLTFDNSIFTIVHKSAKPDEIKVSNEKVFDEKLSFVIIKFDSKLRVKETYTLNILQYGGVLNDNLRGFYKSSYVNSKGDRRYLATTHFEPVGARLAFPCWDEPHLKATFDIEITHDAAYTAISNAPVKGVKDDDKKINKITTFETTPVMSTYLVAFVVSDYVSITNDKKDFTVYTRENRKDHAKYALEIGEKELNALDEYTKIPYRDYNKKMDQISIPDFSPGAMENWGLVTYRESSLLYEENVTTTSSKQGIASVISHEFAHQWFGNLVSPQWWEYIWLNEGFATYFQYYITDKVEKSWRMMEQFVVKVLQGTAFVADSKIDVRPMNHPANSPAEISKLFDNIAYQKAGSVIRMMAHIVGEDTFREGLTEYLKAKKNGAAVPDDLFANIQKKIKTDEIPEFKNLKLKDVMDTWITQGGYPVVTVVRDYKTKEAVLTQKSYRINELGGEKSEDEKKWHIPINYATQGNQSFDNTKVATWLGKNDKEIKLKDINSDEWLIVNKLQTGYYRVNYDQDNWVKIINYLNSENYTTIPAVVRAQLIDDALNLARAGLLSYDIALNVTSYLRKEIDYIPWVAAFSGFSLLNKVLIGTEQYDKFQQGILFNTKQYLSNVTFTPVAADKGEDHIKKLARVDVVNWVCRFNSSDCKTYAGQEFFAWLTKDSHKLPTDLRSTILCTGLRDANSTAWNSALERYKNSKDDVEKSAILSGLACSSDPKILTHYLNLTTIADSPVKGEDKVFSALLANSNKGVDVALDFVDKYSADLVKNGVGTPKSLVTELSKRITTEDQYLKLAYIAGKENVKDSDLFLNALKNLAWKKQFEPQVRDWLKAQDFTEKPPKPNSASAISITIMTVFIPLLLTLL